MKHLHCLGLFTTWMPPPMRNSILAIATICISYKIQFLWRYRLIVKNDMICPSPSSVKRPHRALSALRVTLGQFRKVIKRNVIYGGLGNNYIYKYRPIAIVVIGPVLVKWGPCRYTVPVGHSRLDSCRHFLFYFYIVISDNIPTVHCSQQFVYE